MVFEFILSGLTCGDYGIFNELRTVVEMARKRFRSIESEAEELGLISDWSRVFSAFPKPIREMFFYFLAKFICVPS